MTSQMILCLIIFILMILGYTFAQQLHTTSGVVAFVIFVLVAFSGLVDLKTVLGCWGNANVMLISCMFIVAAGLNRTQAVHKLAGSLNKVSGGNPRRMLIGYVLITFLLSQLVPSPVAVFTIVSPLVMASCNEQGISPSKYMFSIGLTVVGTCMTLPIATGATTFATENGYLESYGYTDYQMQLLDPFKARWLPSLVVILLAIFLVPKLSPDQPSVPIVGMDGGSAKKEKEPLPPLQEFMGYFIFILTTLGLIFQTQLGLASWQVAAAGAALMLVFRVLQPKEAVQALPVRIVMMVVAALALGQAMIACGLGDLIGNAIADSLGGTTNGYVIGAVFFFVPFVLTQFMQNQSVNNIFRPILILACKSLGINPIGPLILLNTACLTAFLTPAATATIPLMMGCGGYTQKDLLKIGLLPSLIIGVVSVFWVMTVFPA